MEKSIKLKNLSVLIMQLPLVLCLLGSAQAGQSYTPSHVFAGLEYANRIIDKVLAAKNITHLQIPQSKEKAAKPMHVYELHVSVLDELHHYAIKNKRRPPPLAVSTLIQYTPTDVYYLTQLVISNVEGIYRDNDGVIDFTMETHTGKTPTDVYQELFEFYYKLNRLNGKNKVSPSKVYAHIYRAKEDLQASLITLSKRLDDTEEEKKRLLVTATYGMHPDGTILPPLERDKKPSDVIKQAFVVRDQLNTLRTRNGLATISRPAFSEYSIVKPIDVFLQTQFIIAELNLLKLPLNIHRITNSAKPTTGKIPSDVYHEMKHINYMLDRLIKGL